MREKQRWHDGFSSVRLCRVSKGYGMSLIGRERERERERHTKEGRCFGTLLLPGRVFNAMRVLSCCYSRESSCCRC
jgi:hypothetical protein